MSDLIKNGGPAFPISIPGWGDNGAGGMTLRDYFAGQALAGDFATQSEQIGEIVKTTPDTWMIARAKTLYRMADAMIAAREVSK